MTVHAEDSLRGSSISKVLNLPLAVSALEAVGAKSLVARQDRQILDFVATAATAIGAVVAY